MIDIIGEVKEDFHWDMVDKIPAGTNIKITVGTKVIFEKTVPINKTFFGRIGINGELKQIP